MVIWSTKVQNGTTDLHSSKLSLVTVSSFGDSAMCFHFVFKGIVIGVAKTEANTWKALWTISLHKIFAAIATGIVFT
ncbi:hypothetical protein ACOSQ2_007606 [Xanthoceras sorbifolium]